MKVVNFYTDVDENILNEIKRYAEDSDQSISKVVNDALIEYLSKDKARTTFKSTMEEVLNEHDELLKKIT